MTETDDETAAAPWAAMVADAAEIADEYREREWTVERAETLDVAPWSAEDGSGGGLVALLTDDSYGRLSDLVDVDRRAFESAEIYRRRVEDTVFLIAVELDAPSESAVVLPLYYRVDECQDALAAATADGRLQVRVRAEGSDDWLTFVHDEPALFEPDE